MSNFPISPLHATFAGICATTNSADEALAKWNDAVRAYNEHQTMLLADFDSDVYDESLDRATDDYRNNVSADGMTALATYYARLTHLHAALPDRNTALAE